MNPHSAEQIQEWLQQYIANLFSSDVTDISVSSAFDELGLDSSSAVAMVGDLEDWLGVDIDPTLPYDFPTIDKLSVQLAELTAVPKTVSV